MSRVAGNPQPDGALVVAVDWVANVLLGSTGTTVAVLAVASVGFLMLTGRLPMRRAGSVIIGCFVLFSAGGIASGLLAAMSGGSANAVAVAPPGELAYAPTIPQPEVYDPYAGAAVPDQSSGDLLE